MTTRIQISDKRGDAILLVTTEGDVPEQVEAEFAAATGLIGLGSAYESFGVPNPVAAVPAAAIVTRPQVPAAAYQQQPQQQAAPGQKLCDGHGLPMDYKSGHNANTGKPWAFWGCTGPKDSRCDKVWA